MPRQRTENLPAGFVRRASGSIQVKIRQVGQEPVSKNFPLFEETAEARRIQLEEAKAWHALTVKDIRSGTYLDTKQAEETTLGQALRNLERSLQGKETNKHKRRLLIAQIQRAAVASVPLARLSENDISRYRDELLRDGWLKKIEKAVKQLRREPETKETKRRIDDLRSLPDLKDKAEIRQDNFERWELDRKISEIEMREGIKNPPRTTITNKISVIMKALKLAREGMKGVPVIEAIELPKASKGRSRRLRLEDNEEARLLASAEKYRKIWPLIIKFAIETALRREKIAEFRLSYIKDVTGGRRFIIFPPEAASDNKNIGIIPVTPDIEKIIEEVTRITGNNDPDNPIFNMTPDAFTKAFTRITKRAGIQDLHFHDLRHEATSRLFECDLTAAEVQTITGHSTYEMIDRYKHYSAVKVYDKLVKKSHTPEAVLAEIEFLIGQYLAMKGKKTDIEDILSGKLSVLKNNEEG